MWLETNYPTKFFTELNVKKMTVWGGGTKPWSEKQDGAMDPKWDFRSEGFHFHFLSMKDLAASQNLTWDAHSFNILNYQSSSQRQRNGSLSESMPTYHTEKIRDTDIKRSCEDATLKGLLDANHWSRLFLRDVLVPNCCAKYSVQGPAKGMIW